MRPRGASTQVRAPQISTAPTHATHPARVRGVGDGVPGPAGAGRPFPTAGAAGDPAMFNLVGMTMWWMLMEDVLDMAGASSVVGQDKTATRLTLGVQKARHLNPVGECETRRGGESDRGRHIWRAPLFDHNSHTVRTYSMPLGTSDKTKLHTLDATTPFANGLAVISNCLPAHTRADDRCAALRPNTAHPAPPPDRTGWHRLGPAKGHYGIPG